MDETPVEKATKRVLLLEQSRQQYIDTRAFWEKRQAFDTSADSMIALLDRDLEINTALLEQAKERLARLSAAPD